MREILPKSLDSTADYPHAGRTSGRIGRGLAANIGGIGVTVLVQLVSVPVLLAAWGISTYGEWLVLSAIPAYLAVSDLSFSSVAGNSMVMLVAQGRRSECVAMGRHLWSIVTVMTGIAVLGAIMIALVFGGAFGPGAAIPTSEAQLVLAALFLQVAVGNQYGVLDAWYRAGGRYPLSSAFSNLGRLLEFGALVGAVLLGASPGATAVAFLMGSIVGFAVSWLAVRRVVPWSTFKPEVPHLQTVRDLFAPGVAFMAFPTGNALSLQGFALLIGSTLGAGAVVIFSTTRTLTHVALLAIQAINSAISPELSRSVGRGDLGQARTILRRAVQLSLFVSCLLVGGLSLVGLQIIRWWTDGVVNPPFVLLLILLSVSLAHATWYTLSSVLSATNRHKRLAVIYLSGTTASLIGAVPLSVAFGLEGTAVALLATDMAMITYVFRAALSVVQDSPSGFLRALMDVQGAALAAVSAVRRAT